MTAAQDLNELLYKAVNLINDRFGMYNVGIFLIDEAGEMAHLKAASGELGAKLVEQGIKLEVGQQGIIGYVTQVGRARIATDVETDNLYLPTPILQETRSEVALPLRVGDRIIGALDIQSRQETKFDRDDVTVLQTLADQLASAIENMRLVVRLQATLKEMDDLSREQVRKTWLASESQPEAKAFEYDRLEVKPIDGLPAGWTAERTAGSAAPANRLVVPVKLHGQIIGTIGLESEDPSHQWTEDEIAIVEATANQAAQTLENARLLAETQQRAAREQLTGEVTARMRASLDVESVLRTAVEEIYQAIKPDNLVIQLMPALEDEK
jgi:GAF domain-containing protein